MLMKKSVGLAVLMMFLLLYPRFAAEGARYGLLLWYTSVVPSLFPFMVLSSLIVSSGGVSLLMKPVRAFLGPWLPLSENGCYTLISGLLCGCPMGAKTCGDFVREGKLSVQEGRFLMAICTHPSPMFLLGFVCPFFEAGRIPPASFFPSICRSFLWLPWQRGSIFLGLPSPASNGSRPQIQPAPALDTAILAAAEILCRIGGYLMLFSIVIVFLRRALWLPASLRLFLMGAMGDHHRSPGSVRLPSLPGLRNRRRCHPGLRRHMRHLPDPGRDCLRMARGKKEPYRRWRQQPKGSRGRTEDKVAGSTTAIYSLEASSQRPGRRHLPAPGRTGLILPGV